MVLIGIIAVIMAAGGITTISVRAKVNDQLPPVVLAMTAVVVTFLRMFVGDDNSWLMQPLSPWWFLLLLAMAVGSTALAVAGIIHDIPLADYNDAVAGLIISLAVLLPFGEHWWIQGSLWLMFFAAINRPSSNTAPEVARVIKVTRLTMGVTGFALIFIGVVSEFYNPWIAAPLGIGLAFATVATVAIRKKWSWLWRIGLSAGAVAFLTLGGVQVPGADYNLPGQGDQPKYAAGDGLDYPKPRKGVKLPEYSVIKDGRIIKAIGIPPVSRDKIMTPDEAVETLGYPFGQLEQPTSLEEARKTFGGVKDIASCVTTWSGWLQSFNLRSRLKPLVIIVGPAAEGDAMKIARKVASEVKGAEIINAPYLMTFKKGVNLKDGCIPVLDTSNRVMIAWGTYPEGDSTSAVGIDALTGAPWKRLSTPNPTFGGAIAGG